MEDHVELKMTKRSGLGAALLALAAALVFLSAQAAEDEAANAVASKPPSDTLTPIDMGVTPPGPASHAPCMNGICFQDYKGFPDTWKLVTVRYRTDTGEQRFVYANPSAHETLKNGRIDYPDGAAFAKIGVITQDDPEFVSSKVPSGLVRYQFMVYDKKRYASTGGWGYALFNTKGFQLSPEDPAEQAKACDACHQIAKDRGFVFSQLMAALPGPVRAAGPSMPDTGIGASQLPYTFLDIRPGKLPDAVRELVPPDTAAVRMLEGPIRMNVFVGTLDEVRPLLAREAARSRHPALLLSADEQQFALVIQKTGASSCAGSKESFTVSKTSLMRVDGNARKRSLVRDFCYEVVADPAPAAPAKTLKD